MIKPDSKYHKGLPEHYFTIPESETVDPDTLSILLDRIDTMVDIFLRNDGHDIDKEATLSIAFILEGMIYQAKEMAINLEGVK